MPSTGIEDARAAHDDVVVTSAARQDHATLHRGLDGDRAGREQVVEHRHADDEAGAHLVDDERRVGVGDARVDLDAAVHRTRVHDLLAGAQPFGRDPPARGVLAQRRHEVGALMRSRCIRRT